MEVRPARDPRELSEAFALREQVFCGEQGVSRAAESDGRDGEALHLIALEEGAVVGTCRLVLRGRTAHLGRLAVAAGRRRRGVGTAILGEAADRARELGADMISLHAQMDARGLYAAGGYVEYGEPFVEEGIDHVTMEKALA